MRAVLVCLVVIILGGCNGTSDPPGWKAIIKNVSASGEQPPRTSDHLIVYIDTSASMAGYVSQDQNAVYGRTLRELRDVASTLDPSVNILTRSVSSSVSQPTDNPNEIGRASIDTSLYNGGDTDIAGAISHFTDNIQSNESVPARFHVLVTDGVQSTKARPNGPCMGGSDEVCVRQRILDLLKSGWGGCILGIRSQFHGRFYSEINRARGKPYPYAIQYDTQEDRPDKFRPFYLYIFSPDHVQMDKFVVALKEKLRSVVKQDGLRELPLTLPYASGPVTGMLDIPNESEDFLEQSKSREEQLGRFTLRVDLNTEKSPPKIFNIVTSIPWTEHAGDTASLQELANMVRWELAQVYPESTDSQKASGAERLRYPEINYLDSQPGPDGKIVMRATARWPQGTGKPEWKVYKVTGFLNLERKTPDWIQNQNWSTDLDTERETGDKTLYLETAMLNLWRNDVLKSRPLAEFYIRVGPK
jgi:hypothetical protein